MSNYVVPDSWAYSVDEYGSPDVMRQGGHAMARNFGRRVFIPAVGAGIHALGRFAMNSLSGGGREVADVEMGAARRLEFGHSSKKRFGKSMAFKNRLQRRAGKKPARNDQFSAYGSVVIRSHSSQKASTGNSTLLDFGHGVCPAKEMGLSITRCLIRMLAKRLGAEISDWSEIAYVFASGSTHKIQMGLQLSPNGSVSVITYTLALDLSYDTHASNLYNAMVDYFTSTAGSLAPNIQWVEYRTVTGNNDLHRVNLTGAKVYFVSNSTLRMQNRTNGVDANQTEITDITANPLKFRSFDVRGNVIQMKNYEQAVGGVSRIDETTGLLEDFCEKDGTQPFPVSSDIMYCIGSKKGVVGPGQFYTSVLRYKRSMTLNKLLETLKLYQDLATSGVSAINVRIPIGRTRGFVFDKYLDTRQAAVDAAKILVGYNVITSVRMVIKTARSRVKPIFSDT